MKEVIHPRQSAAAPVSAPIQAKFEIVWTPNGVRLNGVSGWRAMFADVVESYRLSCSRHYPGQLDIYLE